MKTSMAVWTGPRMPVVVLSTMILVLATLRPAWAVQLDVAITTDNAYGFGLGDAGSMTTYFGGIRNTTKQDIFDNPSGIVTASPPWPYTLPGVGAEVYQLNLLALDDYVYIVAWSDDSAFQGALAGFELPDQTLLTGTGTWEVFATGIDRDSDVVGDTLTLADLPLINAQIAIANANGGGAGTSIGWVDENGLLPDATPGVGELSIGPPNVPDALFFSHSQVQGISAQSHWMWYNEDPANIANPFQHGSEGADGHNEFLIFRTQVGEVVPEPGSLTLLALGGLALGAWGFFRRRRGRPT